MIPARFGMVRVALLGIDTAARMIAEDGLGDPVAAMAVSLATDSYVVTSAATEERAKVTVLRYLARMGGRATPYGLFAGTAVTSLAEDRALTLASQPEDHRVRVRVDVQALELLVREALADAELDRLPLSANPTARVEGETLRYSRSGDASADVVSLRLTPVVTELLRILGASSATGADLVDALMEWSPQLSADAVRDFLIQLLDNGLLQRAVGLIEPGVEPAQRAVTVLELLGDPKRAQAVRTLVSQACGTHPLDTALLGRLDSVWRAAAEHAPSLTKVKPAERFHVDLEFVMPEATVDQRTVEEIQRAVRHLEALTSGQGRSEDFGDGFDMHAFREAFRARYEDAEVPLLAAVDLECGVLTPRHRQVSELAIAAGIRANDTASPLQVGHTALRVLQLWQRHGGSVDIGAFTPHDADSGNDTAEDTSRVRAVLAVLLDDHEGGYRGMLVGGLSRSPSALLARFCLGRPEAEPLLSALTGEHADSEARPIHAELVYHPGGRIGNVLVRPRLTADVLALTGAAGGTLTLDRLLISLHDNDFRLRDAVSGRQVFVELNTAHNVDFHGLDPVYAVLGHLASPGGVGWSWGPLARLPHLPRVTCGSIIVAPEQWLLSKAEVGTTMAAADPAAQLRGLLDGVGRRRWVGVGNYDQVLPIDLDSARSVRAALARETDKEHVQIVEMPQLEAPAVRGPDGGHVAEIVIPFVPESGGPPTSDDDCSFDPARGGSWVYHKYYCGQASADVIVSKASDLARTLSDSELITDWFFLRYSDDGYHVRVRMRPAQPDLRGTVLAAMDELRRTLRAEGLASRVVTDDYVPEVTRYGGAENLRLAESLFTASSAQVADFVAAGPQEDLRLYQAVADMLHWCSVLFSSAADQQRFLRMCQGGLGVSFLPAGNQHGKFFRAHRPMLERHLAAGGGDDRVVKALAELATSVRMRLPERRVLSALGSALHLHCNRLFAFDAVRLEFLGYELAQRVIRQRMALLDKESPAGQGRLP